MRLEERQVSDFDGVAPSDLADDARHGVRVAGSIERRAGVVEIDAFERGREAVRVALAPNLAVGDDVEAGVLLRADREQSRVVLRLLEKRFSDAPELLRADAGREAPRELRAIDQPFRLGITAYECCWK